MKDPECCIDSGNDSESGSKSQTRTTLCTPDSETETMSSECFPLDTGSYNTAVNKITLNSDATQRDQEIKDKIIQDLYELESMVDRVVHPQDVSNRINAQLEEVPNWTDDVSPPNAIFLINTFLVSEIKKTSESREKKSQSM
uniref:SCHIP-1 domain-containing protein n=1 Tax=Rhabditophanes sp. KR3021 TaxID=114890 RepID=A0AC35UC84_9BILA